MASVFEVLTLKNDEVERVSIFIFGFLDRLNCELGSVEQEHFSLIRERAHVHHVVVFRLFPEDFEESGFVARFMIRPCEFHCCGYEDVACGATGA